MGEGPPSLVFLSLIGFQVAPVWTSGDFTHSLPITLPSWENWELWGPLEPVTIWSLMESGTIRCWWATRIEVAVQDAGRWVLQPGRQLLAPAPR